MTTLLNYIVDEKLSHNDRALNYGDGCFTTIRCYKGQAELLNLHAARLFNDTRRLSIFNEIDKLTIDDFSVLVMRAAHINLSTAENDYYVTKILVSRGNGSRGYLPDERSVPTIIISHHKLSSVNNFAACIGVSKVSLSQQNLLAGIKHLNRLEQVLAKLHLKEQQGWDDALMLDYQEHVVELTAANLFFKVGEVWYTPELSKNGVSGVMRACVLSYFEDHNISYEIGVYNLSFFARASNAFSCNALSHLRVIESFYYQDKNLKFDTIETEKLSIALDEYISFALKQQAKENT